MESAAYVRLRPRLDGMARVAQKVGSCLDFAASLGMKRHLAVGREAAPFYPRRNLGSDLSVCAAAVEARPRPCAVNWASMQPSTKKRKPRTGGAGLRSFGGTVMGGSPSQCLDRGSVIENNPSDCNALSQGHASGDSTPFSCLFCALSEPRAWVLLYCVNSP